MPVRVSVSLTFPTAAVLVVLAVIEAKFTAAGEGRLASAVDGFLVIAGVVFVLLVSLLASHGLRRFMVLGLWEWLRGRRRAPGPGPTAAVTGARPGP